MTVRRIIAAVLATFAITATATGPAYASHGADDGCGSGQHCDPPGHH